MNTGFEPIGVKNRFFRGGDGDQKVASAHGFFSAADDLDGDTAGPSICDPSETGERGVFRAIRRVFASFYNDNAFLERRRFGVDEATVGMALLVHPSFPDETELANGVATLRWRPTSREFLLVTQVGAVSVTNPGDGSLPEEVEGFEIFG